MCKDSGTGDCRQKQSARLPDLMRPRVEQELRPPQRATLISVLLQWAPATPSDPLQTPRRQAGWFALEWLLVAGARAEEPAQAWVVSAARRFVLRLIHPAPGLAGSWTR